MSKKRCLVSNLEGNFFVQFIDGSGMANDKPTKEEFAKWLDGEAKQYDLIYAGKISYNFVTPDEMKKLIT